MRRFLQATVMLGLAQGAFAGSAEYSTLLAELAGQSVRNYSTWDFGRQKLSGPISVIVSNEEAEPLVENLRQQLPPKTFAYIGTTSNYSSEAITGSEVVVVEGADQFAILETARTNGANHGIYTEDIISKLKSWDSRYGITIKQAQSDSLLFILKTHPKNINSFALEVYEFCPDIVHQGTGSVSALAKLIGQYQKVFLWWD